MSSSAASRGVPRKRRHGLVHKKPKPARLHNEINVTPLVDVCLVLLIIFMIISKLLSRGKEVPLPLTRHHQAVPDQNQPIIVIDAEHKLYFEKTLIDGPTPEKQYLEMRKLIINHWREKNNKSQAVALKAAEDVTYEHIYPVIMEIRKLDGVNLQLATQEKKDK
ncbi:MAG TPA: biopolymer transporter ExbD [Kofleriaceae bacterium]|nr:biopolymer transporter ExbD [Kofleriaceae bacterium]